MARARRTAPAAKESAKPEPQRRQSKAGSRDTAKKPSQRAAKAEQPGSPEAVAGTAERGEPFSTGRLIANVSLIVLLMVEIAAIWELNRPFIERLMPLVVGGTGALTFLAGKAWGVLSKDLEKRIWDPLKRRPATQVLLLVCGCLLPLYGASLTFVQMLERQRFVAIVPGAHVFNLLTESGNARGSVELVVEYRGGRASLPLPAARTVYVGQPFFLREWLRREPEEERLSRRVGLAGYFIEQEAPADQAMLLAAALDPEYKRLVLATGALLPDEPIHVSLRCRGSGETLAEEEETVQASPTVKLVWLKADEEVECAPATP